MARGRTPGLGYRLAKRLLDIVGALAGLGVTAILFIPLAVCIRLDSRGSIIFRQTRVTRANRPFRFYKFRTMVVDQALTQNELDRIQEVRDPTFKRPDDPRVTRVGSLLRRYSLDELPQFWCVLRGDMSLVGPRPPLMREVTKYQPHEFQRLQVRQGMTGLWQVRGRSRLSFDDMIELDLQYVRNRSLGMDLGILLRTVPVVLRGDGAF